MSSKSMQPQAEPKKLKDYNRAERRAYIKRHNISKEVFEARMNKQDGKLSNLLGKIINK